MARHGLILRGKEAMGSRNVSKYLLYLRDAMCLSKMVPGSLNKIVFIASYIKPQDLFRLQASLGQLPYFCLNEVVKLKPIDVSRSMRNQIKIQAGKNQFDLVFTRRSRGKAAILRLVFTW